MPRAEQPVEGNGDVQVLARAMRKIKKQAGDPPFRAMAKAANYSHETLSSAARGADCPTWPVVKAFADFCDPAGDAARRLQPVWAAANRASRRRPAAAVRRSPAAASRGASARPGAPDGRPRPDPRGTPAGYIYQLRALRAWAGTPAAGETRERLGSWWKLAPATMYDALSAKRTTLPALRTVRLIVMSCLDAGDDAGVEEWVDAWRAISLREFTKANPPPAEGQARSPLRAVS